VLQAVNQIGYVEPPPHPDARAECLSCLSCLSCNCNPLRPLLSSLRLVPTLPRRVRGVFACLFFLFLTWSTTWICLPAFMGAELFGGSPDAALPDEHPAKLAYNEGTRAYSLGMAGVCRPRLPFPHAVCPTPHHTTPPPRHATPHHTTPPHPIVPLLARQARR